MRSVSMVAVLSLLVALLVACGPLAGGDSVDGDAVTGYDALVEQLRAAGASVEPAGEVSQAFFSTEGQILNVNGQQVQVFEYADQAAAQADAALVSPGGSPIGTAMINWVDTPHFYQAGRLLVLYVGSDAQTVQLLEDVLGPQFAGG